MLRHSLPPVVGSHARLLILGSMPGVRSLEAQQYYAQPRNAFWQIMGRQLGASPEIPYDVRLEILTRHRIALWDVLQSCHRPGSLDSAIRVADAVPNDFARFLATHSAIARVYFNGVAAAGLFQRLVAARGLAPQRPITYATLPSTSPANARMGLQEKMAAWRKPLLQERNPGQWGMTFREGLEPNVDFERALELIEGGDEHVFITGRAGTGKTTLLHLLRDETTRNVAVVAPTGLAAISVGGQTIHSFFRLPPRFVDMTELRAMRHTSVMKALDLLIIDEVSMVRADLMDGIDRALRLNRRCDEPFGGVQLAMFGDLWQLPPVVREPELKEYFEETYGGPYFFQALVWRECVGRSVDLEKIYRQKDDAGFRNILQHIRDGEPGEETLRALNSRVMPKASLPDPDSHIVLTATNDAAFRENTRRLMALPGKGKIYSAEVSGKFDAAAFPTEPALTLKVGARVMFLRNDPDRRWINGSWGLVTALGDDGPTVQLEDGTTHAVARTAWENLAYQYDRGTKQITREQIGAYKQLPLRLGWAITIHKSQGQTFDRVYIDLGRGAFSHGQTYVGLSRCRTLAGLALAHPVRLTDVILDEQIGDYRRVFPALL